MKDPVDFECLARIVAISVNDVELIAPGGWPVVRMPTDSLPDWLRSANVGQYVICTARPRSDTGAVELTDWRSILPIGLDPHALSLEEFDAIPEAKLELIDGNLFGDAATRDALLAVLLSNCGIDAVVRMAPAELWHQALDRAGQ